MKAYAGAPEESREVTRKELKGGWAELFPNSRSDSVLASPFTGCRLVAGAIRLIDVGNLRNKRVIRVGVCEHGADRKQNLRNGEGRAPLVPQDIQTDTSVRVDVGVVNASGEVNLGRLERVVGREVDGEEENTSGVWRVARTHDSSLPVEQIISDGTSGAGGGGIPAQISEFLVNALKSHDDEKVRERIEGERDWK